MQLKTTLSRSHAPSTALMPRISADIEFHRPTLIWLSCLWVFDRIWRLCRIRVLFDVLWRKHFKRINGGRFCIMIDKGTKSLLSKYMSYQNSSISVLLHTALCPSAAGIYNSYCSQMAYQEWMVNNTSHGVMLRCYWGHCYLMLRIQISEHCSVGITAILIMFPGGYTVIDFASIYYLKLRHFGTLYSCAAYISAIISLRYYSQRSFWYSPYYCAQIPTDIIINPIMWRKSCITVI